MRITFVAPGYSRHPSGGFRMIYQYANQLAAHGHHVAVVHPRQFPHAPRPATVSVREMARNAYGALRDIVSKPLIDWQPIDDRVKLSFVDDGSDRELPVGDAIFATGWCTVEPVLRCGASKGEKFYLIQGYEAYQATKELVEATWHAPLHKAVVSKWLLNLGKEMGCKDLTYLPNALDHEKFRVIEPIEGRGRRVAMLFHPAPLKGAADGIAAIEGAKKRFPDLEGVFFGISRRKSWIPDWIEYYQNPAQEVLVKEIYNRASVFVGPSWSEGFGLTPAEAAACGCAVAATENGGHREYVQHAVTGLLSPIKDPQALCENLCALLGDEELRVKMARACGRVLEEFNWKRSTDLLEEFIASRIERRSSVEVTG